MCTQSLLTGQSHIDKRSTKSSTKPVRGAWVGNNDQRPTSNNQLSREGGRNFRFRIADCRSVNEFSSEGDKYRLWPVQRKMRRRKRLTGDPQLLERVRIAVADSRQLLRDVKNVLAENARLDRKVASEASS